MVLGGPDYWTAQFGLEPSGKEYNWRADPLMRQMQEVDPACAGMRVIYGRQPEYPMRESMEGIGGTAVIVMTVNSLGEVIDAVVERSSRNRNLDIAAMDVVSIMRFQMQGCHKADSLARVRLPINFIPEVASRQYRIFSQFDSAGFGFEVK